MFDVPFADANGSPDWNALIDELKDRSSPGGDLQDWLFQGTDLSQLYADRWRDRGGILNNGLVPGPWAHNVPEQGVFLGTPAVAAHFAVCRALNGQGGCLIAVPPSAIDRDQLAPDTFMIENPVAGVGTPISEQTVLAAENDPSVCWHYYGSLVYAKTVPPEDLVVLTGHCDLERKLPPERTPGHVPR